MILMESYKSTAEKRIDEQLSVVIVYLIDGFRPFFKHSGGINRKREKRRFFSVPAQIPLIASDTKTKENKN